MYFCRPVMALELRVSDRRFKQSRWTFECDLGQVVHTHTFAAVIEQYIIGTSEGRCSDAKKVTAGLASNWPYVTDFVGYTMLTTG